MSVIMMLRVKGDPKMLETWAGSHGDQMVKTSQEGKKKGAMHHMFAAGDNEIVVIDEWPDEASFKKFYDAQPDIPKIMQAAGAQGQPEITFFRKMPMPDEF